MIVSKSRLMEVPINTLVQSETSYIGLTGLIF